MDRRIRRTKQAIFDAFDKLVTKKDYAKISVQDIIDEADIGRSTFYEHFETKDELLRAKCTQLFEHVFSPFGGEKTHEFPRDSSLKERITHILYHFLDDRKVIGGILSGSGREIFSGFFRAYLATLFQGAALSVPEVPQSYLEAHVADSFIGTVSRWMAEGCTRTPEEICGYFFALLPAGVAAR